MAKSIKKALNLTSGVLRLSEGREGKAISAESDAREEGDEGLLVKERRIYRFVTVLPVTATSRRASGWWSLGGGW